MDHCYKIINLLILGCLVILNCPLIYHFITVRGGYIIFHYWFLFMLKLCYNYFFLKIDKFADEYKNKISKTFYLAINDRLNVKIRLFIDIIYVSLFVSLIYIMIFYNDTYMTKFQQTVYLIDFVAGTILYTTIKEHEYFYRFNLYENILFVDEEESIDKKEIV
jgi:hypothetical protein